MSYRKRRRPSSGPIKITAKFESECAETGKPINVGDECWYYPNLKKVYHMESEQAAIIRNHLWNKAHNMPDANW